MSGKQTREEALEQMRQRQQEDFGPRLSSFASREDYEADCRRFDERLEHLRLYGSFPEETDE